MNQSVKNADCRRLTFFFFLQCRTLETREKTKMKGVGVGVRGKPLGERTEKYFTSIFHLTLYCPILVQLIKR